MSLEMTRASMRRSILSGAVVAGLLAFGVGGWAATAELAGAVIAPGVLVVEFGREEGSTPDRRCGWGVARARWLPGQGGRCSSSAG